MNFLILRKKRDQENIMTPITKIVALAMLVAPVAQSAQDAPDDATNGSQVEAKKDKKVCRRIKVTGTRMPQRVCMLQSQWDAAATRNVDDEIMTKGDNTDMGAWSPFSGRTSSVMGMGSKRPD
jgi:hypothetical protein